MKIKTPNPLPENATLGFKIVLGVDAVWLKGRVVYSQLTPDLEAVSGIRFMEVSKAGRALLRNCLASLGEDDHRLSLPAMYSWV
jgi:hypothetical protein